jgi:hypothetical protein
VALVVDPRRPPPLPRHRNVPCLYAATLVAAKPAAIRSRSPAPCMIEIPRYAEIRIMRSCVRAR